MSIPLQINDLFWTVQGEGRWSGHRALFVRMPYCNYECPWCDTEYNSYKTYTDTDFKNFCNQEPARFAVITGGEPMVHKDTPRIIEILKNMGFYIACETNGSAPIPNGIDFVTVSPKAFTKSKLPPYYIHDDALLKADEWKYVVDENFDFNLLKKHSLISKPKQNTHYSEKTIYSLSPEFSQMLKNTKRILNFISENPQWKLSLQTHKWIQIP